MPSRRRASSERQMAGTLDPIPLHSFEGPRPALFLGHVREDPRLLGLPDPPCRLLFKRKNWRGRKRGWLRAPPKIKSQGGARFLLAGPARGSPRTTPPPPPPVPIVLGLGGPPRGGRP